MYLRVVFSPWCIMVFLFESLLDLMFTPIHETEIIRLSIARTYRVGSVTVFLLSDGRWTEFANG